MAKVGKVKQIIGAVVDVQFQGELPEIYNSLEIKKENGLIEKQTLQSIYVKLKKLKQYIVNSDQQIKLVFENRIPIFSDAFQNKFKNESEFLLMNFRSTEKPAIQSALLKFKNDVLNTNNMIVMFCKNQIGMLDGPGMYGKFSAIIVGNTKRLSIGDELSVYAGVGEFSTASTPIFFINGEKVLPDGTGLATYKMKIKNKPGKYTVPVIIKYVSQDGSSRVLKDFVEYNVDK